MHVAIGSPALWIIQAEDCGHPVIILAYAHEPRGAPLKTSDHRMQVLSTKGLGFGGRGCKVDHDVIVQHASQNRMR